MLRIQISLRAEQRTALDVAATRSGRSLAVLIRDLIDAEYQLHRSLDEDLANLRASAGGWADDDRGDGSDYVEGLRSGRRLASAHNP